MHEYMLKPTMKAKSKAKKRKSLLAGNLQSYLKSSKKKV